jgi:hypothetical protein
VLKQLATGIASMLVVTTAAEAVADMWAIADAARQQLIEGAPAGMSSPASEYVPVMVVYNTIAGMTRDQEFEMVESWPQPPHEDSQRAALLRWQVNFNKKQFSAILVHLLRNAITHGDHVRVDLESTRAMASMRMRRCPCQTRWQARTCRKYAPECENRLNSPRSTWPRVRYMEERFSWLARLP